MPATRARKPPAPYRETPQFLIDGKPPPTLGPLFVAWAEATLTHGEGDMLGQPYKVPAWGKRAAYRILEYDPGKLVTVGTIVAFAYIVRRALLIMPKGSAKTEFIAALMLFLLAGPSLPTPDGPVMRPSPNIPLLAGSWEQVDKLYGKAAVNMATGTLDSPAPLASFVECFDSEIQLREAPGSLYRVAAVAGTNDGGLPTAAAADEIHELTGRKRRAHLVITQGLEKRVNGLELNITTPDDADPDSLLGEMNAYAEKVTSGEVTDPSYYVLHYGTDPQRKITNKDGSLNRRLLVAALRDATPAEWVDINARADSLIRKKMPLHEIRRYWLAAFARGGGHWLPEGGWEARRHPEGLVQPADGTEIVASFDGSYRRDSTVIWGCTLGGHLFEIGVWERPPDAGPNWKVPRGEVKTRMTEAGRRWQIVEIAPDPPGWHDEIEGWESEFGEIVVEFPTNQTSRMVPACNRFYAAVAGGDEDSSGIPLTHDGSLVLARHLRNAVTKPKMGGDVITKESTDSPRKIDAAIGAVVAYDRACWHALNVTEPVSFGYYSAGRDSVVE